MEISIVIKMQQVNFETSMKNIPLGGKKEYVMQLTKSVRKVVYAMSWAAFIFLNNIQCEEKETYGFRSQKKMPIVDELEDFKDALVDLVLYGDSASINRKNEVWGYCRHSKRHMLSSAKVPAL